MSDPFTPLVESGKPRLPVNCRICGTLTGAFYRSGVSYVAYRVECTERCEALLSYAEREEGSAVPHRVPRGWEELPNGLRQPVLAVARLDHAARELA